MILLHVAQRRVQGPKGIGSGPQRQQSNCFALTSHHKVHIYIECTTWSPHVGLVGTPPPPLSQAWVPLPPQPKGGGGTLAGV